jgi:hypothetical protein
MMLWTPSLSKAEAKFFSGLLRITEELTSESRSREGELPYIFIVLLCFVILLRSFFGDYILEVDFEIILDLNLL